MKNWGCQISSLGLIFVNANNESNADNANNANNADNAGMQEFGDLKIWRLENVLMNGGSHYFDLLMVLFFSNLEE